MRTFIVKYKLGQPGKRSIITPYRIEIRARGWDDAMREALRAVDDTVRRIGQSSHLVGIEILSQE